LCAPLLSLASRRHVYEKVSIVKTLALTIEYVERKVKPKWKNTCRTKLPTIFLRRGDLFT
jgi:hypothetical protein